MHLKSIAALGFAAAVMVLGTAPASAHVDTSDNSIAAGAATAARYDATSSSYRCGCGRRYVRYYYTYRVRYVRYYYY
jgi:hypothetical protein